MIRVCQFFFFTLDILYQSLIIFTPQAFLQNFRGKHLVVINMHPQSVRSSKTSNDHNSARLRLFELKFSHEIENNVILLLTKFDYNYSVGLRAVDMRVQKRTHVYIV